MTFWLMTIAAMICSCGAVIFARDLAGFWRLESPAGRALGIAAFGWFLAVIFMFGFFAATA